jgi:protein SCO1/2
MKNRRYLVAGAGAATLAGLGAAFLGRPDRSVVARSVGAQGPGGIPNVPLKTHTGATVRFYDDLVRDKLVVINMMYASCSNTCPPMTQNLVRVQQLLKDRVGKDIFMYSITLKPEQDSPQDLAQYAKLHRVQPGWLFLTGTAPDIEQLRFALGYYDPDPVEDKAEGRHVNMVRIGNTAFKRWGMVPALADPMQIVSAISRLDLKPPALAG